MIGRCKNCKHWLRGTWRVYSSDAKTWEGYPHPDRGKTIWNAIEEDCYLPGYGECQKLKQEDAHVDHEKYIPPAIPLCGAEGNLTAELLTSPEFGCVCFELMISPKDQEIILEYNGDGIVSRTAASSD